MCTIKRSNLQVEIKQHKEIKITVLSNHTSAKYYLQFYVVIYTTMYYSQYYVISALAFSPSHVYIAQLRKKYDLITPNFNIYF